MFKSITQEEFLGCGCACVAFALGISYKKALSLFDNKGNSSTKGFYCKDIVYALNKRKKEYIYSKFKASKNNLLKKKGTIVFIKRNKKYPEGHYVKNRLVRKPCTFVHV